MKDPGRRLSEYELLSEAERQQILYEWNHTRTEFPSNKCVHQLFEEQTARTPNAVAVICEDAFLTYAQLNHCANQLAHYLHERGVGPDGRVAICADRSLEMIVAMLAVLKAGGAYVPLESGYPPERLGYLIEDCAPTVLLVQPNLRRLFSRLGPTLPLLELTGEAPPWQHLPGSNLDPDSMGLTSRHLAYVIYTSGSTGQPKGVMVDHRAIARLVLNNHYANFQASDRVAFASNPAFDAATLEIWAPLLNGGRIVVISQPVLLEPARFVQALEQHEVNVLWLTVGLFNQYSDLLGAQFPRLRYLLVGGDALDPKIISGVLRSNPPQHLLNGYGPTETTTFAATYLVSDLPDDARSVPIGRAIANTQIYILDDQGEPVPVGVAGELYIAGAGVARGYLKRTDLTAEKFVPDPFATTSGQRMYRTGDLGRWRSDGNIEFLGRNDFQVKIRGFRVELGEIEARLMQHPAMREVVVIAQGNAAAAKQLIAYYTAEAGAPVTTESLHSHLAASLPGYMVPAAYVRLEAFPLTSNGKVNRKALPVPQTDAYLSSRSEPPHGKIETRLAQIWAEVLQLDRVGRHDNFFELGGHSLLATQVVARMSNGFGVEIALRRLFESPTVEELAVVVEQEVKGQGGVVKPESAPLVRVPREGRMPLSYAQQRLWFLDQLMPGSGMYNIVGALRVRGELNLEALNKSLQELVRRHEVLRTRLEAEQGEPWQVIEKELVLELPQVDLSGMGEGEREAEAVRLVQQEAETGFDLKKGPLLRVKLMRLSAEEHVLVVNMHHVVSDAWSMGVLVQEVSLLYPAYAGGKESRLEELAIQYADYSAWQRKWLVGEVLEEQLGYWREQLGGVEVLELPTDRGRAKTPTQNGTTIPVVIAGELAGKVKELTQRERSDAVHDVASSVSGVTEPLQWAERYRGGIADSRADASGDGESDRVFREHAGVARAAGEGDDICRAVAGDEGGDTGGVCAPGCTV